MKGMQNEKGQEEQYADHALGRGWAFHAKIRSDQCLELVHIGGTKKTSTILMIS